MHSVFTFRFYSVEVPLPVEDYCLITVVMSNEFPVICWVTELFIEGELDFDCESYAVSKLSIIVGITNTHMKCIPFKTSNFLEYTNM